MIDVAEKKILIVEDEQDLNELISTTIKAENFFVDSALNGLEGLDKVKSQPLAYKAIVTDLIMPKLNGLEFIQKLKELNINIPVVILSGNAELPKLKTAIRIGVFDYLLKPFDSRDLIDVVYRAAEAGKEILKLQHLLETANTVAVEDITKIRRKIDLLRIKNNSDSKVKND